MTKSGDDERIVVWRDGWLLGLDDYVGEALDVRRIDEDPTPARTSAPPVSCVRASRPDDFVTG